jgi:hypothetical protein
MRGNVLGNLKSGGKAGGGRAINASQVINRKQVQVQRRRAFSIHVG